MNRPRRVPCPTCRTEVEWSEASPWRPFCSARCRGIDLGDWASDRFVIPGEAAGGEAEPTAEDRPLRQ